MGPGATYGHAFAQVGEKAKLSQLLAQVAPEASSPVNTGRLSVAKGWRVALSRQIEIAGKSGARYRYTPLEEDRFVPPAGANYIIAELKPDGPSIVYAGETDNLANLAWRQALEEARKTYAHARVLTRLNVTRAVREAERADLVEQYQPPLNQRLQS